MLNFYFILGGFLVISPYLIYYIFGEAYYVLGLKPKTFIDENYKNLTSNENFS